MDNEFIFHRRAGRPKKYKSDKQRHEAKLESKRKWYANKGQDRVHIYNQKYYDKHAEEQLERVHNYYIQNKKRLSKKHSKRSKHHSKHHSKHRHSKHHSGGHRHSKHHHSKHHSKHRHSKHHSKHRHSKHHH